MPTILRPCAPCRHAAVASSILLLVALAGCARPPQECLLPSQKPMLMIDLFFGRGIEGRAPLTDAEWAAFAAREITPRFPDGFTVIGAQGQWLNPQTGSIGAEASTLVRIDTTPGASVAPRIAAIAAAYRTQFHQLAVGISSVLVCAAF